MTILALNATPPIGVAQPKTRKIRRWLAKTIECVAASRMRRVQRELDRYGITAADKLRR